MFGHYWATVTAVEAYGTLMDATGTNLVEFLENVNILHDRITSTFIGYIPPYFEVDHHNNEVALTYESKREGLTPFVCGIVRGLAERFDCEVTFGEVEMLPAESGELSKIPFTISI